MRVLINDVANYITKLRGLKLYVKFVIIAKIFVANYITKLHGLKHALQPSSPSANEVANYITKLRGLKPRAKLKPAADFY